MKYFQICKNVARTDQILDIQQKVLLRWKFTMMENIKTQYKINNLNVHSYKLNKHEQFKIQSTKRKEIMKVWKSNKPFRKTKKLCLKKPKKEINGQIINVQSQKHMILSRRQFSTGWYNSFNTIRTKISVKYFMNIDKLILKFLVRENIP